MAKAKIIGFVPSYPKMIVKPGDEKQYEGGNVVVITSGIYLPIESYDEED